MSHVAKKSNTKAKQNIESGIRGNVKVTHPGRGQGFRLRRRNYRARRAGRLTRNDVASAIAKPVSTGIGLSGSIVKRRKGTSSTVPIPQHGSIAYTHPSNPKSGILTGYSIVKNSGNKAELIGTTTTVSEVEHAFNLTDPSPFRDFAFGVYKRAKRCRISLSTADRTDYDLSDIHFGGSASADVITLLTEYFYEIYNDIASGKETIYDCPRNIAFMLQLFAFNNYALDGQVKKKTRWTMNSSSHVPLTPNQVNFIATLMTAPRMGFDFVTVPTVHSKPFVSTHKSGNGPNSKHNFVIYDNKVFGSIACVFDSTVGSSKYISTSNANVEQSQWPIIAALATPYDPTAVYDGHTNILIAIPPEILRQYIAYEDTLFDAMYIFSTDTSDTSQQLASYATEFTQAINALPYIMNTATALTTDPYHTQFNATNLAKLDQIVAFSRMVYAPFLSVATPATDGDWISFGICAAFRGPLYIPSIIHESIVGNTSCTTMSLQLSTGSWRGMIFHYSNTANTAITQLNVNAYVQFSQTMLRTRAFAKINHVPESTPSQAFIPSFFMRMSVTGSGTDPLELVYTPYSYNYIDHHNLNSLATSLWWPTLSNYTQGILSSLSLTVTMPSAVVPAQRALLIDYIFDYSYQADSSEIDHYLFKVRTNYLGLFGFLKGLAAKAGNAVSKLNAKVIKPLLSNPLVQTVAHIAGTALGGPVVGNMIDAGISMIQSSPPGDPATDHITDLAEGQ